jgi:hypothetical protein
MANSGPEFAAGRNRQGTPVDIPLKIESKSVNVICMKKRRGLSF